MRPLTPALSPEYRGEGVRLKDRVFCGRRAGGAPMKGFWWPSFGVGGEMSARVESLETRRLFTELPAGCAQSMVAQGFDSPTSMVVAPDGRVFVAEQPGRLRIVKD